MRYTCDAKNQQIRIEYVGAYNKAGEHLLQGMTKDDVNPWNLVVTDAGTEPRHIVQTKTVTRYCKLKDGLYTIELRPSPCNSDVQGENGMMMRAIAIVRRGSKELAKQTFGSCVSASEPIATKLLLRAGNPDPVVTRKPADEYFQ